MELMDVNEMNPGSNVQAYLQRIGYTGGLARNAATLAQLQELHLHHVPYENLDILQGKPISLEIEALYHKIVTRRRGGYCFELNALFGWLLRQLGYQVADHVGRFWRDEPNPPPKRRHHVLKVEVEGNSYLCDVGVGGIVPKRPLLIADGATQEQDGEIYRLRRDEAYGWFVDEQKRGDWHPIYSFTEEPQLPKDYVMASFWCEHAPDSIFRQQAMLAIRTREGRNTASGREFRIFGSEGVAVFTPDSEAAYDEALQRYFGISIKEE